MNGRLKTLTNCRSRLLTRFYQGQQVKRNLKGGGMTQLSFKKWGSKSSYQPFAPSKGIGERVSEGMITKREGKITLRAEDTKNSESRAIFMEEALLEVIHFQRVLRERKLPKCPWVFFGETGERIKDFRGSWAKACKEARIEGRLFHDFRRTGIRNRVRAGVPERVSMMISGHKIRSVFERYNIVNENDLKQASKRVEVYHLERAKIENGHNTGTVTPEGAELQLEEQPSIH